MGCIAIDKQAELNQASYEKIAKEFSEIPAVKQLGQSSIGLWKAMVYNATKGRIPEDGIPNTEQLKLLKIVKTRIMFSTKLFHNCINNIVCRYFQHF